MGERQNRGAARRAEMTLLGAALCARLIRGERIDSLESLGYFRLKYLEQRAAGAALPNTEYGWSRARAMKPVLLPRDSAVPASRVNPITRWAA